MHTLIIKYFFRFFFKFARQKYSFLLQFSPSLFLIHIDCPKYPKYFYKKNPNPYNVNPTTTNVVESSSPTKGKTCVWLLFYIKQESAHILWVLLEPRRNSPVCNKGKHVLLAKCNSHSHLWFAALWLTPRGGVVLFIMYVGCCREWSKRMRLHLEKNKNKNNTLHISE